MEDIGNIGPSQLLPINQGRAEVVICQRYSQADGSLVLAIFLAIGMGFFYAGGRGAGDVPNQGGGVIPAREGR